MKHQFMHKPGEEEKRRPIGSGTAEPQHNQAQPTPANPNAYNSAGPIIQQSSNIPYSAPGQPHIPPPQGLPRYPSIPQGNPGQSTPWGGPPSQVPNGPGPMNNFIPPGPPAGSNHGNNFPNPTNKPYNPGNLAPSSTHPNGNFPGPMYNSPQMRSGNPSSSGIPGTGHSLSGIPGPSNSFSGIPGTAHSLSGIPGPGNSFPSNNTQMAGNTFNNTNNVAFRGGPPPPYQGNSFPGMTVATGGPNPYGPGPQGPGFQRPVAQNLSGPKSPPKKPGKRLPLWSRIAIGLLVFLVVVSGGAFAYYETQVAPSLNNILGKQAIHHTTQASGQSANQVTPTPPTGRTNILLLGSDTDGKGNDANVGTPLAQTVMIITIDPQSGYVGMLSIPRDMQVTEMGYREPKLDEVFSHGYTGSNIQDKVASGAGTMEDIIQTNFGIHIDHYAWVGLNGFVKVIDTAGGIDVDTIHPMVDDSYPDDVNNPNGSIYDYKRLYIAPGPQHLNGPQALDYVRTRHSDLIGDFGRTVRQQQIINQLKVKLATPDTIGKASELLQDLNGAVQTDMQLSDVVGLANIARNIDTNKVDRLTLGPPDYAVPNLNGDRTSNYLPVCENIVPKIQQMFNITSPTCLSQAMSNTSSIARTTQPSTTAASTALSTAITPDQKQSTTSHGTVKANMMTSTGTTSVDAGIHGLLDILFATTFGSFDAMQI